MSQKNISAQLKSLQGICPQSAWLKSNREILLAQINNSGAENISHWQKFLIDIRSFSLIVSKPVGVVAAMFMFLAGTAAFSHLALSQAKPDDSLYIARIISEKAKLSTVLNSEEKEKMQAQFAASHAEAITEVLTRVNLEESGNEDKLAQLSSSFNKEMNIVREKMVVINKGVERTVIGNISQTDNVAVTGTEGDATNNDDLLQVADSHKDDAGTQLLISQKPTTNATNTVRTNQEVDNNRAVAEAELADILDEVKNPEAMLEEVQALFDAKNYQGALEKIREVKAMIK